MAMGFSKSLFIGLLSYSCLLGGAMIAYQYHREKQFKAAELNAALQVVNNHIIADIDSVEAIDFGSLYNLDKLRVSVIDVDGNVIFDNSTDSLPVADHRNRQEIAGAIATGSAYAVRRVSDTTGDTYFYSALKRGDYIVRTAVPYSVPLQHMLSADKSFLWVMIGVMAVMCVIGYFATRRIGLHVMRLNEFAAKAEKGERIYDTAAFPRDELGDISSHIVKLYAKLQQAVTDRDREHQAALHEEREKIRIKRQLTNNINHELKTPLAAIKVCLETMMSHRDMDADKRDEFLRHSFEHASRLQRLLDDVSVITRLDEGSATISHEQLDLNDVVDDVCEMMKSATESAGFKVSVTRNGDLSLIGNQSLLTSIFYNLIDNALSYSGGNEINIKINGNDSESISVQFNDNGSGVSPEFLERIFERFFRVDKGRSRQHGGTGLGLSIVKNSVMFHGGEIKARNAASGGLEIGFSLKRVTKI